MTAEFKIGNITVGHHHRPYFIADIGANHDGDLNRALKLIELAKLAGAHAAKFQNFKASKIVSKFGFENLGSKSAHQLTWKKSVFETYEDASISMDWTPILKKKCDAVGIEYFTSPYDKDSVDHVDQYVNVYKIGSGDITWPEIIEYIAAKGKPVLLATGASNIEDVKRAVETLSKINPNFALLQCNTNYTLDMDKFKFVNLNVLKFYKEKFPNTVLGLSDHTIGHATVAGSIALGARIIEKHFTDDNSRIGPDHKFAMNPISWRIMVDTANEIFEALGDGIKRIENNEIDSRIVQQRCLRVKKDLAAGTVLEIENIEALRPCPDDALRPYEIDNCIGKPLLRSLRAGEHISKNCLQK